MEAALEGVWQRALPLRRLRKSRVVKYEVHLTFGPHPWSGSSSVTWASLI